MSREFLGRGWRFPFAFDGATGGVQTSAREQNIEDCINVILGTRPGERVMQPDFGCRIQELVFAPSTQATATLIRHHITEALTRWEPRIDVTEVDAIPRPPGAVHVTVRYRIKSTAELKQIELLLNG